jgi:hypothetical protein
MARLKINIDNTQPQIRQYNIYQAILQVALKRECDIAHIRLELLRDAQLTGAWLCMLERAGIEKPIKISAVFAQSIEKYFTAQLGYPWRLEIRPVVPAATRQVSMAV